MDKRVRTGCATCRRRRVKCDEARPICNRCRTANFHCEGYAAPRRVSPTSSASSPEQARCPDKVSISELSCRHRDWRQEQLPLYHHFVTTTVVRLFRNDHLSFWRDQVAQMSFDVDLVHEALLAIGAVHRSSLISCLEGNGPEAARFKVLGLRAYGKTIKLLPSHLGRSSVSGTLPALIVLMLLAYFECFLENTKGAFRHLWAAIQLLRSSEENLSNTEVSKIAPILDSMIRLDFVAQNLVPYACSSFLQFSDQAIMEPPFWNRPSPQFLGMSQADYIAAERYRLIQLVCAHNKMNRIVWGPWCPPNERPTRDQLLGFYSEMILWKETSPATFTSYEGLDDLRVLDMAAIAALPLPPPAYFFGSNEAALNVAMYNGYMGCVLAMINATDPYRETRELETFNLLYQNLCIAAGLIIRHYETTGSPYKPCDAISMGISIFLYHGARHCFSPAWQQTTITTLRLSGREGLSNGFTFANAVEIMCQLEKTITGSDGSQQYDTTNTYLSPIKDRLIPLLMPRGDDDELLAFYLKYETPDIVGDQQDLQVVAKATWSQDSTGIMHSLKLDIYEDGNKPQAFELFSSWRQAVENGWHGYLSHDIQDGFHQRMELLGR